MSDLRAQKIAAASRKLQKYQQKLHGSKKDPAKNNHGEDQSFEAKSTNNSLTNSTNSLQENENTGVSQYQVGSGTSSAGEVQPPPMFNYFQHANDGTSQHLSSIIDFTIQPDQYTTPVDSALQSNPEPLSGPDDSFKTYCIDADSSNLVPMNPSSSLQADANNSFISNADNNVHLPTYTTSVNDNFPSKVTEYFGESPIDLSTQHDSKPFDDSKYTSNLNNEYISNTSPIVSFSNFLISQSNVQNNDAQHDINSNTKNDTRSIYIDPFPSQKPVQFSHFKDEPTEKNEFFENFVSPTPIETPVAVDENKTDFSKEIVLLNEKRKMDSQEIAALKEQLHMHAQTLSILVKEKTELTDALAEAQNVAKQKSNDCEELQNRLKASRHRVSDLERELSQSKNTPKTDSNLSQQLTELNAKFENLNLKYDDVTMECNELRAKLVRKTTECATMQQELNEKTSQASLLQVKLQQLISEDTGRGHDNSSSEIEQKLNELEQALNVSNMEKEQMNLQTQQYISHLNSQLLQLEEQLNKEREHSESLNLKQLNLINHIGNLEKLLQDQQKAKDSLVHEMEKNDSDKLSEKLAENEKLMESLKVELEDRNALIAKLESERSIMIEKDLVPQPDMSALMAQIESDKLAASRAVNQNVEMKKQIQELETSFINLSNDKLELTEKLQSESHIRREIEERLGQAEANLEKLKTLLQARDEEMLRMENESRVLRQQVEEHNQAFHQNHDHEHSHHDHGHHDHGHQEHSHHDHGHHDHSHHDHSHFDHGHEHHHDHEKESMELDHANAKIAFLEAENEDLKARLQVVSEEKDEVLKNSSNKYVLETFRQQNDEKQEPQTDYMVKERAMRQLEEKFKKIMDNVADLTDEKQKLEHIVMQLQSETETIGEYVALYQYQRSILKQRTHEKDEQLKQLAKDREEIKLKIAELNELIKRLLIDKRVLSIDEVKLFESHQKDLVKLCDDHAKVKKEMEDETGNAESRQGINEVAVAGKIITLLSEIKTSNLVQPAESFHPCPWCSGQLITI